MKVAVCGGGPLGIEMALALQHLGSSFTLYTDQQWGGNVRSLVAYYPDLPLAQTWSEVTSERGRQVLVEKGHKELTGVPTLRAYWELYLNPLVECSGLLAHMRNVHVKRVHKRFLSAEEEVPGRSRLHDLFRVVYRVDARKSLERQKSENPEAFKNFGPELLDSLAQDMEQFEDFDLVIDARGSLTRPLWAGPGQSSAIGEEARGNAGLLFYGKNILNHITEVKQKAKKLALVGSGQSAAFILGLLEDWLYQADHELFLITTETNIFHKLRSHLHPQSKWILERVENILKKDEIQFFSAQRIYEKELKHWEDLDDYVKAKTPGPVLPKKRIHLFEGFNVTAVDRLLDRRELFLTLESPDFRNVPQKDSLKTVGVDCAFVCTGHKVDVSALSGMRLHWSEDKKRAHSTDGTHPEPGFYTLGPVSSLVSGQKYRYHLAQGLAQVPLIVHNILKYFSRAHTE